jgi:hypothetical protein
MKIVFKGEKFVKLYVGEVTYDNLLNFLNEELPDHGAFALSFKDDDGD